MEKLKYMEISSTKRLSESTERDEIMKLTENVLLKYCKRMGDVLGEVRERYNNVVPIYIDSTQYNLNPRYTPNRGDVYAMIDMIYKMVKLHPEYLSLSGQPTESQILNAIYDEIEQVKDGKMITPFHTVVQRIKRLPKKIGDLAANELRKLADYCCKFMFTTVVQHNEEVRAILMGIKGDLYQKVVQIKESKHESFDLFYHDPEMGNNIPLIPVDAIALIFDFLDDVTRMNISLTSRFGRDIITKTRPVFAREPKRNLSFFSVMSANIVVMLACRTVEIFAARRIDEDEYRFYSEGDRTNVSEGINATMDLMITIELSVDNLIDVETKNYENQIKVEISKHNFNARPIDLINFLSGCPDLVDDYQINVNRGIHHEADNVVAIWIPGYTTPLLANLINRLLEFYMDQNPDTKTTDIELRYLPHREFSYKDMLRRQMEKTRRGGMIHMSDVKQHTKLFDHRTFCDLARLAMNNPIFNTLPLPPQCVWFQVFAHGEFNGVLSLNSNVGIVSQFIHEMAIRFQTLPKVFTERVFESEIPFIPDNKRVPDGMLIEPKLEPSKYYVMSDIATHVLSKNHAILFISEQSVKKQKQ